MDGLEMNTALKIFEDDYLKIVITDRYCYTYSDFRKRVNSLVTFFKTNQIRRVLIDLPQCYNAYCIMWASYLAGITFCCINNEAPNSYKNSCIDSFSPNIIFDNNLKDESEKIILNCINGIPYKN